MDDMRALQGRLLNSSFYSTEHQAASASRLTQRPVRRSHDHEQVGWPPYNPKKLGVPRSPSQGFHVCLRGDRKGWAETMGHLPVKTLERVGQVRLHETRHCLAHPRAVNQISREYVSPLPSLKACEPALEGPTGAASDALFCSLVVASQKECKQYVDETVEHNRAERARQREDALIRDRELARGIKSRIQGSWKLDAARAPERDYLTDYFGLSPE